MEKKWFPLAKKSVAHLQEQSSPGRNIFKKTGFHIISIMLSTCRKRALKSVLSRNNATFKKLDSSLLPPAGRIFLKNWIFPDFNNSFH